MEITESGIVIVVKLLQPLKAASSIEVIQTLLSNAGFSEIRIESKSKSREFIKDWRPETGIENYIISATIEAVKKK